MNLLTIATDGACSGNPGPGGWGYVLSFDEGSQLQNSGSHPATTNNRMELQAAIEALRWLETLMDLADEGNAPYKPDRVVLITDSKYVLEGITKWIHGWIRKGWIGSSGNPVKNQDLWEELHRLNTLLTIEWSWVKGHSGHPLNEIADSLANAECGLN